MNELEEIRNEAFESTKLYKESIKAMHDKAILQRTFLDRKCSCTTPVSTCSLESYELDG